MKELAIALAITRLLKQLRDSEGGDLDLFGLVGSIAPQLGTYFGKDLNAEELDIIGVVVADLISLLRS